MKLAKGDAAWSTQKIILGWLLDTAKGTLSLPSHKAARLRLILAEAKQKTRASRCQWQKLLGELRHMASALWGAKYLFPTLQHVLSDTAAPCLRLSPLVKATLHDWSILATSLETHPVPITSLVPRAPSYLGTVDASSAGCGGFWAATKYGRVAPFTFRWKFPTAIQHQLISPHNPLGTLTNSDLELSAVVLGGGDLLRRHAPTASSAAFIASDNTPTVSWLHKGSTTSIKARAYLLHRLAQITRSTALSLHPVSVPGNTNLVADFCSRSFHLTDQELLRELNTWLPITPSWTLVPPPNEITSSLTSALLRKLSPWESVAPEPTPLPTPSPCGTPSAETWSSTPPWNLTPTPSQYSRSLLINTGWASSLPAKLRSVAEQWEMPFVPLATRWPGWDAPTQDYNPVGT
jgi:hypothetical protein